MSGLASVFGIEINTAASIVLERVRTALTFMEEHESLCVGVWITQLRYAVTTTIGLDLIQLPLLIG
jgi:hypothetical protein